MTRMYDSFLLLWKRFLCAAVLCWVCAIGVNFPVRMTHAQETGDVGVSAEVPGVEEEEEEEEETPPPSGGPGAATIPDNTPPFIFNLRAVLLSPTQMVVMWQTDEEANSLLEYAPDDGATPFGRVGFGERVVMHKVPLAGLTPCTGYRYRVRSADAYGNEAVSVERVFSMPCDGVQPELIGVRVVEITDHSAVVVWTTREPASSAVEYGETVEYGSRASLPGFVSLHAVPIAGLQAETTYHVRAYSQDPSGNEVTSGDVAFRTLADRTPPANVGLLAIPGDQQVTLRWFVSGEDVARVRLIRRLQRFPSGPQDGEVLFEGMGTEFIDTGLRNGTRYYYGAYAIDDAGNIASGSIASAVPRAPGSPISPGEELPGTVTEPPSIDAPPITVRLLGADGTLVLGRDAEGRIGTLAGSAVLVRLFAETADVAIQEAYVRFGGATYPAVLQADGSAEVMIGMPRDAGILPMEIRVRFEDGRIAAWEAPLLVQGFGRVFIRPLVGPAWRPILGAVVTLFQHNGTRWIPWDGGSYGQPNPRLTDEAGRYAFQVPVGRYVLEVKKQGYVTFRTSPLFVESNVVALPIRLIAIPGMIEEGESMNWLMRQLSWLGFGIKMVRQWLEQPPWAWIVMGVVGLLTLLGIWNMVVHRELCIERPHRWKVALLCVILTGVCVPIAPSVFSMGGFGCAILFFIICLLLDHICRIRSLR